MLEVIMALLGSGLFFLQNKATIPYFSILTRITFSLLAALTTSLPRSVYG